MDHTPPRQRHQATMAILAVGALAFALAQTSIVPALSVLQDAFGVSTSEITWMVTGYFLAASIATPILGRLGDIYGKERLLAVSLAAFAAGSLVCALSTSLEVMIAGRVLQGLGGGVFPLSFGIVRDEFPRHKVPTGIALLGATVGVGAAIGLPLGGLLVDQASWHWIFWISTVMGVATTVTTILFVPESPVRTPSRIDFGGAALLAVGLSAVLLAISRANDWGWTAGKTVALFAAGLAVLALFVAYEQRHPAPMINMKTLVRPAVLTTNLVTLCVGVGMFGTFILIPEIAQLPAGDVGLGLNALQAGLLMAPGGLVMLLAAPVVGRIGERAGSKPPLLAGCSIAGLGLLGMALWHDEALLIVLWAAILNAGVGCAFAALPNLIVGAVEPRETGEATGVNMIARNLGASLGGQVAGSIVASQTLAGGLPADSGFRAAFLMGAGVCFAATAVGTLIPTRPRAAATAQALEAA